ncbi:MAG: formate dehydrogenase accessory protein FdhE [Acidobacteria bacterium]|nr:formate dehydrogenase accessory protein FdhE [Acidobacteriota bacterium]
MQRFLERAERAAQLANRYPAAREPLKFFAGVSLFQDSRGDADQLCALILRIGPPAMRDAARHPEDNAWIQRVLGEMDPPQSAATHSNRACPKCGSPPQLGVLRPCGDGSALYLACSLCRHEWTYPRTECPHCGRNEEDILQFAQTEDYPHIQTLTCEECQRYMHIIDLGKDSQAIPEADEISAQPLDIWAIEGGYIKIYPNLIGL